MPKKPKFDVYEVGESYATRPRARPVPTSLNPAFTEVVLAARINDEGGWVSHSCTSYTVLSSYFLHLHKDYLVKVWLVLCGL
jgi:hypothetical protein